MPMDDVCIIVDDDPAAAEWLADMLQQVWPQIRVAGRAASAEAAETLIRQLNPGLVWLDIQLGAASGFDLLRRFSPCPFEVVVVTGFDSFGIEAVKHSAVDYLLKPVDAASVAGAMLRLQQRRLNHVTANEAGIKKLLEQWDICRQRQTIRLPLPQRDQFLLVTPQDIRWLQAKGSYTRFFLRHQPGDILIGRGLYQFEPQLVPLGFCKCHQSYLINLEAVTGYLLQDRVLELVLDNQFRIPVSRNHVPYFKQHFNIR